MKAWLLGQINQFLSDSMVKVNQVLSDSMVTGSSKPELDKTVSHLLLTDSAYSAYHTGQGFLWYLESGSYREAFFKSRPDL